MTFFPVSDTPIPSLPRIMTIFFPFKAAIVSRSALLSLLSVTVNSACSSSVKVGTASVKKLRN
jgi:hypothetical protein